VDKARDLPDVCITGLFLVQNGVEDGNQLPRRQDGERSGSASSVAPRRDVLQVVDANDGELVTARCRAAQTGQSIKRRYEKLDKIQ